MDNKNEIDLVELLIKVYLYLKKYIWILLLAVSIGIIYTLIKSNFQKDTYTSSMLLETKSENNYMYAVTFKEFQNRFETNPGELIIKIINSANELRKNGNLKVLAKRMELTEEQVKGISSIQSIYQYKRGEAISNLVTINASSSDKEVFNFLSSGIINYINNNKYITDKNKSDSIFLTEVINKIDKKIKEIDSLQTKSLNTNNVTNIFIYQENSLFSESIMLNSLREKLEKERMNIKQVQLVEDFYIPNPSKNNIKFNLIVNIAIFTFIGFLIIFFLILNKKANIYITK